MSQNHQSNQFSTTLTLVATMPRAQVLMSETPMGERRLICQPTVVGDDTAGLAMQIAIALSRNSEAAASMSAEELAEHAVSVAEHLMTKLGEKNHMFAVGPLYGLRPPEDAKEAN